MREGSAKGEARKRKARKASEVTIIDDPEQKKKELAKLMNTLNKDAGYNIMFKASDLTGAQRIPSNIYSIDRLTGGGLPRGRFTEIFGAESVGKTTLALRFISECQKTGGSAVYIDAEHSFDPVWATINGVDVNELVVAKPQVLEDSLLYIDEICKAGAADIIVLDSIVALSAMAEKAREITDESIGIMQRKLSQFFRRSVGEVAKSNTAVILINQVRVDINSYGAPESAPGGNAIKHYKSLSILMRRASAGKPSDSGNPYYVKDPGDSKPHQIGFPMAFKVMKNKVGDRMGVGKATPGSEASVDFYYSSGLDVNSDIINSAMAADLPNIKAGGAGWYTYIDQTGEEHKVQGKQAFVDMIAGNEEYFSHLKELLEKVEEEKEKEENDEA